MYLKKDNIVATVGKVTMRSSKVVGLSKNFILDPTAVSGWTDGTNVRRDNTVRLVKHGDFSEKATMGARLISFSGTAVAKTMIELQEMRDDFVGTLSDGSYGPLTVTTKAGTRTATVGLEGRTSWVQQADLFASWKIDFYAPDAFIYGEWKTSTISTVVPESVGGLTYILTYPLNYNVDQSEALARTVTNKGNAKAWPVYKIIGNIPSGFELRDNRDNIVAFSGQVSIQAPVTIDMRKGTATQGGVDKSTLFTARDWFGVDPGEIMRPVFMPYKVNGAGRCDILIRDTWI